MKQIDFAARPRGSLVKKDKNIFPRPGIPILLSQKDGQDDKNHIQIFRAGTYNHYYYGQFALTAAIFLAMVENFRSNVLKLDLMIDYDHKREEAAAWVKNLYLSDDQQELWAEVEWTPPGAECLENKLFRYISGEWHFNHADNESGVEYGPVLMGAALTNRPFIKGMSPTTELHELNGGYQMDLVEAKAQIVTLNDKVETLESEKATEAKRLTDLGVESAAKIKALSDENASLKAASETAKKEGEFLVLLSEGKAVPAQKEAFIKNDMAAFIALAGKTNPAPNGSGAPAEVTGDEDKETKILKLAEEKFAKGGVLMADCVSAAKKELK